MTRPRREHDLILENNGVCGLTKGQFSATADKDSKAKKGATNKDTPIDTVSLAILKGATFAARSFSGDKTQLAPHNEAVNRLDFWPNRDTITVDYSEGGVIEVPQHDGSIIRLRKLAPDFDPSDKVGSTMAIARAAEKGEVLTGLLYLSPDAEDLHAHLNTYPTAFNTLREKELCPGAGMLGKINAGLRPPLKRKGRIRVGTPTPNAYSFGSPN